LTNYQTVLDSITFHSTAPDPTNAGSNATRTLSWVVNDGGTSFNLSTAVTETLTLSSVANVNNPPTLTNVAANASFTEEGPAVTLSGAVSVSDPDNPNLVGATVKITGGTFVGDGDTLSATGTSSITVSYNSSTETLVLTGTDTLAHYQSVLDTVTFASGPENP